jgi:hypothetical protein
MGSRKDFRPYEKAANGKQFSPVGVWKNDDGGRAL